MIESDFFRTQQGRDYFSNQIKQIRDCVVLTCNHEVMWTLLTTSNCKRHSTRLTPLLAMSMFFPQIADSFLSLLCNLQTTSTMISARTCFRTAT